MTSSIQLHFSGWCHSIHGISCCSHRCAMGRSRLPPTHPPLVKNFRFFGCFSLNKNSHLSIIYPLSNPRLHTYGCSIRSISKAKPLFVVILFMKVNAFESRQKYSITQCWENTLPTSSVNPLISHPSSRLRQFIIHIWSRIRQVYLSGFFWRYLKEKRAGIASLVGV